MTKITIITRAFNRLEYTIQCVKAVKDNTYYDNYQHLIINNNSNDGTKEWLDWIAQMPNGWYNKVKSVHSPINLGDWGGLLMGLRLLDDDVEYIVQLDNDILVPPNWLRNMIELLEHEKAGSVMLKREGLKREDLGVRDVFSFKNSIEQDIFYSVVGWNVACFVMRKSDVLNLIDRAITCDQLTSGAGKCLQIMNHFCYHIDAALNYNKYGYLYERG